jgi:hypothetical protein
MSVRAIVAVVLFKTCGEDERSVRMGPRFIARLPRLPHHTREKISTPARFETFKTCSIAATASGGAAATTAPNHIGDWRRSRSAWEAS